MVIEQTDKMSSMAPSTTDIIRVIIHLAFKCYVTQGDSKVSVQRCMVQRYKHYEKMGDFKFPKKCYITLERPLMSDQEWTYGSSWCTFHYWTASCHQSPTRSPNCGHTGDISIIITTGAAGCVSKAHQQAQLCLTDDLADSRPTLDLHAQCWQQPLATRSTRQSHEYLHSGSCSLPGNAGTLWCQRQWQLAR